MRDAGYKVVLTGEGSDEILGGYPHFRRDMLLYNRDGQDPAGGRRASASNWRSNPVSRGLLLPDGDAGPLEDVKRVLGFVPSWIETFSARAVKMRPYCSRDFPAEVWASRGYHRLLSGIDVRGQLKGRDPVHQSLYLWAKTVLPDYILTILGDRMEMAHSIEGRVPFLDHHVVEVIRSPAGEPEDPRHDGEVCLREAAATSSPIRCTAAEASVPQPAGDLESREELSTFVQDTLRGAVFASIPFFDQSKVVRLLDSLHDMDDGARVANDQTLMTLVSICVLQERFRLGDGSGVEKSLDALVGGQMNARKSPCVTDFSN